jgi:methylmalonyl-CoA mutase cobalamin-binding subunit
MDISVGQFGFFIRSDKTSMIYVWRSFFILAFSVSAWADHVPFKAFRQDKIQLKASISSVASGDELTVMLDQNCMAASKAADKYGADPLAASGLEVKHKSSGTLDFEAVTVRVAQSQTRERLRAAMNEDPCVVGVSESARVYAQSDPLQERQLNLPAISFARGEKFFFHPLFGIRAPVNIAVVDSGVQMDHPDLASRFWSGAVHEHGIDFVNNDADPSDDFGHGTHVAGLICAQKDNGIGIRGVMGEWSKLMAVKTQGADGSSDMATVINGVRWAVDHGAEVINLSLSSHGENALLKDALEYAVDRGVTVVTASGNDGEEVSNANFVSPVGYAGDLEGLIGVGAIDYSTMNRASYSNYGPKFVEIAAPASHGVDGILSTYPLSAYKLEAGTSMAAPQVAGAAALVKSFMKTRGLASTPAQIESLIESAAIQNSQNLPYFASGRALNLENLGKLIFNLTVVDSTGGFDD